MSGPAMDARTVSLIAISGLPMVGPGDDLAHLCLTALEAEGLSLENDDIVVVAQKIVSKAEGRFVRLSEVAPSARACELAALVNKDPRLVEVILSESTDVIRHKPDVLIVEHKLGYIMANAGIDQSNVEAEDGEERVLLLPRDPDATCAALKARFNERSGADVGVIINDSAGRAWRMGTLGFALGVAGLPALYDQVGRTDLYGRPLRVTEIAFADEIAAAASLVMGQAAEGRPVVIVRGLSWDGAASDATALLRPRSEDLFR